MEQITAVKDATLSKSYDSAEQRHFLHNADPEADNQVLGPQQ